MNYRRTRAMARKEFLHIIRDPRSLIMALAVPLFMLLLFGYALTLDVDRIPTMVYDSDQTADSRDLIQTFNASRYFDVIKQVGSYAEIERAIDRDQVLLGIAIPNDYSRNLQSGRTAEVQLLFDGSDSNTASIARGYAEALVQGYRVQIQSRFFNTRGGRELKVPVEARLRTMYNSELKSKNYIVPGLIAVILMIIAALLTSLTIAREWEMGTMEQLLSTPVRPNEIVLGKMAAFFGVGMIDTLIALTIGVLIFGVPLRGSVLFMIATSCIFLFGALCWGMLISAIARQQLMAYQMGILTSFLPAFLLSGFVYSIENMPPVIQAITHIFPARYFVSILKGVFLKGVGLEVLWGEVLFLVAYGALVFFFATRKLRQKLV